MTDYDQHAYSQLSDQQLLVQLQAGDDVAFGHFYERYADLLVRDGQEDKAWDLLLTLAKNGKR